MIRERLEAWVAKIDAMSLRERVLIFAAAASVLIALIDTLFLDPLLQQRARLTAQITQQQEKMKEAQARLVALIQAKQANQQDPRREQISQLRKKIAEGEAFLKKTQDKLVPPERMAHLLKQLLVKNGRLQLVALENLPVSNLIESADQAQFAAEAGRQVYKHGVKITVRGSYADLTNYLQSLEKLPTQMYWGGVTMQVVKYPDAELTLILYTLSLDQKWLQI